MLRFYNNIIIFILGFRTSETRYSIRVLRTLDFGLHTTVWCRDLPIKKHRVLVSWLLDTSAGDPIETNVVVSNGFVIIVWQ